jgi:hypothetical protein
LSELAGLIEDRRIKKVLHDAKPLLAFLRTAVNRKLYACNIFDLMLASQICWSGYYHLTPFGSHGHPWKKNIPDHSLASLAERIHLALVDLSDGSSIFTGCDRSIKDCPKKPSNVDPHPDMIAKIYNIQIITPIFGGGVKASENDPLTPIRPSSIRGISDSGGGRQDVQNTRQLQSFARGRARSGEQLRNCSEKKLEKALASMMQIE